MDFHTRRPPSDLMGRSQQRRLLRLILGMGLVLVLMREVRKPERWQWLTDLGPAPAGQQGPETRSAQPERAATQQPELGLAADTSTAIDGEAEVADDRALAAVRDNTPFQQQERDAWYGLFRTLRDHDDRWLSEHATRVTFVQLDRQPHAYRGELVSLRGIVRMVAQRAEPVASSGIAHYYQVWLQPHDQPDSLVVAYCLELPPEFPTGNKLEEPAVLNGYFFKRWAYQAQDGIRTVPLLLARSIEWRRHKPATPPAAIRLKPALATIALVLVTALLAVWTLTRRSREPSKFEQYVKTAATGEPLVPADLEPSDERIGTFDVDDVDHEGHQ